MRTIIHCREGAVMQKGRGYQAVTLERILVILAILTFIKGLQNVSVDRLL